MLHQVNAHAPSVGIRVLCDATPGTQQPPPSLWVTGRCTGLHMALDTRRPLAQRTSIAGRLRRSVGAGGPEEAQLLQVQTLLPKRLLVAVTEICCGSTKPTSCKQTVPDAGCWTHVLNKDASSLSVELHS